MGEKEYNWPPTKGISTNYNLTGYNFAGNHQNNYSPSYKIQEESFGWYKRGDPGNAEARMINKMRIEIS